MTHSLLVSGALALTSALACAQELPKELSGRWTWAARNVGQTFALEDIQRKDPATFTASLTWWTINPSCVLRSVPITGRITDVGISFEATTNCKDTFTAQLTRSVDGWKGTATTKSDNPVVTELWAK